MPKRNPFKKAAKAGKPRQRSTKLYFLAENPEQSFLSFEALQGAYPGTDESACLCAASKIEFQRYQYLWECQGLGQISGLKFHPKFTIVPAVKLPKNAIRDKVISQQAVTYEADFSYSLRTGRGLFVIEDTKAAFSNSEKNKEKKRAGKPILQDGARDKHKAIIAQMVAIHEHEFHFRLVTDARHPVNKGDS
jgi:hypothetical protein